MLRRKKIGIVYSYNENWIGGTYYIQNIIQSFNLIDNRNKPALIIFTINIEEYISLIKIISYPYITHQYLKIPPLTLFDRLINKGSRVIIKRQIIFKTIPFLDILFPAYKEELFHKKQRFLYWIPDFQEHYLPQFFSREEIETRKNGHQHIIKAKMSSILFSSNTAYEDYKKIYPHARTNNYVVQFAVTHPDYNHLKIEELKLKYGIRSKYFISPNQFWIHKNHKVIIDAVKLLKDQGKNICIVFTGKPHDHRYPKYYEELLKDVYEKKLSENILFLGFIDRAEQLKLMKNAEAVIQPSLFEGWSTVVEDAKAMNQFVIASNIKVHLEQVKENGVFFNPESPEDLAQVLAKLEYRKSPIIPVDYTRNIEAFATNFLKIIK